MFFKTIIPNTLTEKNTKIFETFETRKSKIRSSLTSGNGIKMRPEFKECVKKINEQNTDDQHQSEETSGKAPLEINIMTGKNDNLNDMGPVYYTFVKNPEKLEKIVLNIHSDVFDYFQGFSYLVYNPRLQSYAERLEIPDIFWGFWFRYVFYLYEKNTEKIGIHISKMETSLKKNDMLIIVEQ
jgi:hypothetical protein